MNVKIKSFEIIQSEEGEKEKKLKKSEESLCELCNTIKWKNIHIMGIPGEEEERKRHETYLKK